MADLITIEYYKQAKALTSAKDEERLGIIVPSVSQLVKTYCGNSFVDYVTVPYTEYLTNDWPTCRLLLTEIPVISVSEVWERTDPTSDYVQLTEDEDFVIDDRVDMIDRLGTNWPTGVKAVKVTYTAGYAELPTDLKLAVIDLISYYFYDERKTQKQLFGASITQSGTTTLNGNIGFPDHIKRVLDLYRQI